MSRLYDTVEPAVIDEEMLQKAVEEQGPRDEAGRIAKQEGIDFADVLSLRLDFKNILKIDNLWRFTSLTKLQMDNNIIEKIEGMDALVNLVWLDLSFNNIEVIEGLDKLTKIRDLTLYNNKISCIENMDALVDLHVLSVGNNELDQLENLIYLRRFKQLKTLNLSGNPFCDDPNFKHYVIAYLPTLQFLDYRLIDENTRAAANEQYTYPIQQLEHNEEQARKRIEDQEAKEAEFNLHKGAYVENLNGSALFDSMFADDTEGPKLALLPGVDELLTGYKDKYTAICQQIFEYGLKEHQRRGDEVSGFQTAVDEAKEDNRNMGMRKINDFNEYRRKMFAELAQSSDQGHIDTSLEQHNKEIDKLWDSLMALEMQLVDQLEDTIKEFERNMADMVSTFVENVQALISQCRDLENTHNEKLLEVAIVTLEKMVKNELDDELPDDVRMLFVDKDTITNAVGASHDLHLLKIDNKEDDIITRANNWLAALMERVHNEEEVKRNRLRVSEVNNFIDHLREEVETFEIQAA
ncbi:dynein regulatory complex subunit 3-like [Branchiostoma lanceolatum]|uniref:dynein regulatory complex subunit 3-like n=1 Tax=Branchiostoma lanceolatum TaxID=7740 RepID=UPI0034529888